jgi:predicted DCC family thiol-disulfide oxidoreductase YuxK
MQTKQSIAVDQESPGGSDSPQGLILFDGVCVLCSRGCHFVSKRDRRGYFRFVPIQMAEGRPLADQLGIDPDRPDSFAFVANGQGYVKSEAVLRIARELPRWQWYAMHAATMMATNAQDHVSDRQRHISGRPKRYRNCAFRNTMRKLSRRFWTIRKPAGSSPTFT